MELTDNMRELMEEADRRFANWMLEDAATLYAEAVEREPDYRYAVNQLAKCYAIQGKISKLISVCLQWEKHLAGKGYDELAGSVAQAVLKIDPASVDGRICALEHVRKTKGEEDYFTCLEDTVNYCIEIDECERAIKVLQVATQEHPTNVDIAIKLSDVFMADGDIEQAKAAYRKVIADLESSGSALKAALVYRKLEFLTPDDITIIMRLAEIYYDNEQYDDACNEYRNALKVDYSNLIALRGLGNCLMQQNDYDGAVLAYRKAVVIDPDDVEAREALAKAYIKTGNIDAATKDLLTAGNNLLSFEDYAEAERVFTLILTICPDHPVAVRSLSNIKDALARQRAREEQIRKLQSGGINALKAQLEQERAAKAAETGSAAAATATEGSDDPYAGGTDIYGDDLYGAPGEELGAPGSGSGEQLGAMAAAGASAEESASGRVLVTAPEPGKLCVPVPFVVAKYPEMAELIQQMVSEAPSQDVFGWKPLAKIETKSEQQQKQEEQEVLVAPPILSETEVAKVAGQAVQSAFASTSGGLFSSDSSAEGSSGGSMFGGSTGGGLFGGSSGGGVFGVKSRFKSNASEDSEKGEKDLSSMSLVERIQWQQQHRGK